MPVTAGRIVLIAFLAIVLALGVVGVANVLGSRAQADALQTSLNPFYTPPDSLPTDPGAVIRVEPLTFDDTTFSIEGGSAYRMLYVSQRPDGTPAASGAMIFVPDSPAPPEGRPVVAWAHGTVGMGDACAPSRSPKGTDDLGGSLAEMVQQGWVVVATDYVGLGTPGVELYIVAQAEANDVVNSVRAARNWEPAQAGATYAVFGHSQGGHSSLWTGHLGPEIAPELNLVGVAAAAPAAELKLIMGAQWDTAAGWALGPEAAVAWKAIDPDLPFDGVITEDGQKNTESLAEDCILRAALEGELRSKFGGQYFEINPAESAPWARIVDEQTPPPLPASMPVFVAQGTADEVVLPWPQAVLQEKWCAAGSNLTMLWMGDIDHMAAAKTAGPQVVTWIADRFAGKPATPACDGPMPVPPAPPAN